MQGIKSEYIKTHTTSLEKVKNDAHLTSNFG